MLKGSIKFYIENDECAFSSSLKFLGKVDNVIQCLDLGSLVKSMKAEPSAFYYCPKDGEIWARIELEFGNGWIAKCRPCKKHGGTGSLLATNSALKELEDIPEELARHELMGLNKNGNDWYRPT